MKGHGHSASVHRHGIERKTATGYIISSLSITVNVLLFALKYWVGLLTPSVAIMADAWHTLSDTLTSLVVLIGFKVSAIPPDRKHPFGHGRAELIAALIVGILLALVAFNFLVESVHRLIDRQAAAYGTLALIAVAVSVVSKEVMAQVSIRAGKRTNSPSLIADGWHHRSDAISSLLILVGIVLGGQFWWTDGVLGIMVSVLIFYATFEIMKNAISHLLGEEPGKEIIAGIDDLSSKITSYDLQIHDTKMHDYGRHKELTLHIYLPAEMKLSEAHEIAQKLEIGIWKQMGIGATIHVDPLD
ncbi:MAG: cation transporter [Candidatus Latescibacteria bacterium]|nr:cation transporter [Candidatus Latescibacterota bacterium]